MCGIAGIVSNNPSLINIPVLRQMSEVLRHRGPDGDGIWINKKNTIGLAHRRLAIIDLTPLGAQPMHYLNRYSIVYNGELYNYIELRNELKKIGYHFVSESDTEVLLAAYDCYKEKCLQYFDGMFSFAIWDEQEQELFAARDRFGEKPFYYYATPEVFIFGSEMKALWASGVDRIPEQKMMLNFITLGHVQNPSDKSQTFYKDIFALPPSSFLLLKKGKFKIEKYWHLDKQITINISAAEAMDKMNELLSSSVTKRLRSDVAVGTSLSGGLDSSAILYYIKQLQNINVQTFSATFPGFEKDESFYIKKVTNHFNVPNFSVSPNESELVEDFEKLIYHQEEPFSSSSIYAQYRVYKMAKENGVKVLIDGQGADEILAGYHKYAPWYLQELINHYHFIAAGKELDLLKKNNFTFPWGIKNWVAAFFPSHVSIALEKKEYNKSIHHSQITQDFMSCTKGHEWEGIHKTVVTNLNDILHFNVMENGLEELLRFSDRNAMSQGCEVRLPFLQHDLVSFIFSLPSKYKIQNGFTKSILRNLMSNRLPSEIIWRKDKVAYEPPQKKWMETQVMKDYIFEAKRLLVNENILKPHVMEAPHKILHAHDADNYDWRYLCVAKLLSK